MQLQTDALPPIESYAQDEITAEVMKHVRNDSLAKDSAGEFSVQVHQYLNRALTFADTKAFALVGANLTIATLLLSNQSSYFWILVFNAVAVVTFGSAALIGVLAIYPRLDKKSGSPIFWEGIVSRATIDAYVQEVMQLDQSQIEQAYAAQNYHLSEILCTKYRAIQRCARLFTIGIIFACVYVVLGTITVG